MNIFESIIDYTLDTFSPYVFDDYNTNDPIIKSEVRDKIISDVSKVNDIVPVENFFIKGSILTKQWSTKSDIDVFIQIKDGYDTESIKNQLKDVWMSIDDKKIDGIPHPLQYYITESVYNFDNTEAAYDLKTNEWIKKSPSKDINVEQYLKDFNDEIQQFADYTEDIRRLMIDYDILKEIPETSLSKLDVLLSKKLKELETTINGLLKQYETVKVGRENAFSKDMSPSDIKKYGVKTKLPGNVIFKLIERYYYKDLARKLKKIIGKDKKLSKDEYEELNDTLKTNLTKENVSFKSVFNETDEFGRPSHRQTRLTGGLTNTGKRKHLNILPNYQKKSPKKSENLVNGAKKFNQVIKVKLGTHQANEIIKKYRIQNPQGEKIVGGNQTTPGIKVIFI